MRITIDILKYVPSFFFKHQQEKQVTHNTFWKGVLKQNTSPRPSLFYSFNYHQKCLRKKIRSAQNIWLCVEGEVAITAAAEREYRLRGLRIPVIENLGIIGDAYECLNLADNSLVTLGGFPRLVTHLVYESRFSLQHFTIFQRAFWIICRYL